MESKHDFTNHICTAANEVYAAIQLIEKDATKTAIYKKLARCYVDLYQLALGGE